MRYNNESIAQALARHKGRCGEVSLVLDVPLSYVVHVEHLGTRYWARVKADKRRKEARERGC